MAYFTLRGRGLVMARRRMIDPTIWDDEDVGSLSDGAFRLFVACISSADDDGKLEGSAIRLRGVAFRFRSISVPRVQIYLNELTAKVRSVQRYFANGREYIRLANWAKYQTIRADKRLDSHLPDPLLPPGDTPGQSQDSPRADEVSKEVISKEVISKEVISKEGISKEGSKGTADKPPNLPEALAAWRETWKRKLSTKIDIPDKDATHLMKLLRLGESVADLTMVMDYYVKNEEYAWADWNLATMCGPRYAGMKAKAQSVPGQVGATSKFDEPYEEYLRQQEADSEVGNTGPT
jgi:hypothetical protein